MSTRIYGLLWRPEKAIGNSQLLISNKKFFKWSHAYKDNTSSRVFGSPGVERIIEKAYEDSAYWIGPEEMSGWNDDA